MKKLALILLCLIISFSAAYAGDVDIKADVACFEGMSKSGGDEASLTNDEFMKVWEICKKAAESGARGAQNLVGMGYLERNKELGIFWLKKAAAQGHSGAIEELEKLGVEF